MNSTGVQRIGIFGGTFDPVHLAHIELAKFAYQQCALAKVIFVPCALPPHRRAALASSTQRREMLEIALSEHQEFAVSTYELNKVSTSFTVETLEYMREAYPDNQLVFCMGGDSLRGFSSWHRWQDVLRLSHLVVMNRSRVNGSGLDNVHPALLDRMVASTDEMVQESGQILMLDAPEVTWSSTQLRDQLVMAHSRMTESFEENKIVNAGIDTSVLKYIVDNKVYQ